MKVLSLFLLRNHKNTRAFSLGLFNRERNGMIAFNQISFFVIWSSNQRLGTHQDPRNGIQPCTRCLDWPRSIVWHLELSVHVTSRSLIRRKFLSFFSPNIIIFKKTGSVTVWLYHHVRSRREWLIMFFAAPSYHRPIVFL